MANSVLFHGSPQIVERPSLDKGNPRNDYGRGFYCTPDAELAKEWACKRKRDGFANRYKLKTTGLHTLDLLDGSYTALHWIALLLKNREFSLSGEFAVATRDLILSRFLIDLAPYDLVVGYRADDAYFSFAESFVEGALSLGGLERALKLGNLGEQTVLISEAAFDQLTFESAEPASCDTYFPRFLNRDNSARSAYRAYSAKNKPKLDELVAIDILRMEEAEFDARIQRISLVGDAKRHLGDAFDYALNDCSMAPDDFAELFMQSGIAALFGEGNPAVVSGMSGPELARAVMSYAYGNAEFPERRFAEAPTPEFWAGWALAQYQHARGRRFTDVFRAVPLSEILLMHRVYHEMDVSHFADEMDRRISEYAPQTHLQAIRLERGLSQTQLASLSGVNVRNIRLYEQRVNDIGKAQAITLYRLAHVLGCRMESLLENPTV